MRMLGPLLVLCLAGCGAAGDHGFERSLPGSTISIVYGALPTGIDGHALPGQIVVNELFEGTEQTTLDPLSVLLVHELWHELVSLDHLPAGCYASEYLSVGWGDPPCSEERQRWVEEAVPGRYVLRVLSDGLREAARRAAQYIGDVLTQGRITFTIL
jgi:hypothetical protein